MKACSAFNVLVILQGVIIGVLPIARKLHGVRANQCAAISESIALAWHSSTPVSEAVQSTTDHSSPTSDVGMKTQCNNSRVRLLQWVNRLPPLVVECHPTHTLEHR